MTSTSIQTPVMVRMRFDPDEPFALNRGRALDAGEEVDGRGTQLLRSAEATALTLIQPDLLVAVPARLPGYASITGLLF